MLGKRVSKPIAHKACLGTNFRATKSWPKRATEMKGMVDRDGVWADITMQLPQLEAVPLLHQSCLSKQTDLPPQPRTELPLNLLKVAAIVVAFITIVIVVVGGHYHHHGPVWLTFRSFAATSIASTHPPFTHSFSQSASQSFRHSIRHSRFRIHTRFHSVSLFFSASSLVKFLPIFLGVKVVPSLFKDSYKQYTGFK